jgi:hypothetical protein
MKKNVFVSTLAGALLLCGFIFNHYSGAGVESTPCISGSGSDGTSSEIDGSAVAASKFLPEGSVNFKKIFILYSKKEFDKYF